MMKNAVKQFLTFWSCSQFLICVKNMLLINKMKLFEVWKLQCTFGSLFYDQSCALETCFIITWQISGISTQFRLFLLLYHMWQRHFRRVHWQFNILISSSLLHVYYLVYTVVIFNSFSRLVSVYYCLERFPF